ALLENGELVPPWEVGLPPAIQLTWAIDMESWATKT
ncbi:hypothetical protein A2U01_0057552, partial [Trifolium medium]|nr:hypothetical protein [Trifolium medium]